VLPSGQRLRVLREQLGLTIRDVEAASTRIAARHGSEDFAISPSRLSDIETKGILPNIYRLYSLSAIYRKDLREFISGLGSTSMRFQLTWPLRSHPSPTSQKPWMA